MDAACDLLIEQGRGALSSPNVARAAGVSRGALTHHFPTADALLQATVVHIFGRLVADFQTPFGALPPQADRLDVALALLWQAYTTPANLALVGLYSTARTDPALRALLLPLAMAHRDNILLLTRAYFPALCQHPQFEAALELVLHTFMGMSVALCMAGPEGLDPHPQLALLRELIDRMTQPEAAP